MNWNNFTFLPIFGKNTLIYHRFKHKLQWDKDFELPQALKDFELPQALIILIDN